MISNSPVRVEPCEPLPRANMGGRYLINVSSRLSKNTSRIFQGNNSKRQANIFLFDFQAQCPLTTLVSGFPKVEFVDEVVLMQAWCAASPFDANCQQLSLKGGVQGGSFFASSHLVCVFASSSAIHPCASG